MTILVLILATLAGSLLSLLGGMLLLRKRVKAEAVMLYAMPFGAGALLGAAFLSVLPEALHEMKVEPHILLLWALAGFTLFFIMERSVRWFHRHHEHGGSKSQTSLIVIGDTLHNAIDGVAIGAAFLINVPAGIVTTLAVAAHELPQEIGDFGLLLGKGMKKRRVLAVNIFSSLATVAVALVTFGLGGAIQPAVPFLLAIVAGMFVYIAAADIIPDIHEQPQKRANIQSVLLLAGIAIIPAVGFILEGVFGLGHSH